MSLKDIIELSGGRIEFIHVDPFPMKGRYEIQDTYQADRFGYVVRGQRFTNLDHARRELTHAVGNRGRFIIVDRKTKEIMGRSK